jgi:hypothetical protein
MANEVALLERLQRLSALQPQVALSPSDDPASFDHLTVDFPVVVRHEGQWLLFYTGSDGKSFRLGIASSQDLQNWNRLGLVWDYDAHQNVAASWLLRHNDLDEPMAKLRRGEQGVRSAKSGVQKEKIRRLKSALRFFRHQLRVKTRSMNDFVCVTDYGLKSVAWFAFGRIITTG